MALPLFSTCMSACRYLSCFFEGALPFVYYHRTLFPKSLNDGSVRDICLNFATAVDTGPVLIICVFSSNVSSFVAAPQNMSIRFHHEMLRYHF